MPALSISANLFRGRIPWRTNLILIPGSIVLASLLLFGITQVLDRAQFQGSIHLPSWVNQGGAGDCRDLVSATAGAIITTLGLVLSITVLIFSTAATQFGQRLLRGTCVTAAHRFPSASLPPLSSSHSSLFFPSTPFRDSANSCHGFLPGQVCCSLSVASAL